MLLSPQVFKEILSFWGIHLKRVCHEFLIPGSPERTEFRVVIESKEGLLLLLEKVSSSHIQHKIDIATVLDVLRGQGLKEINPYIKSLSGEQIVLCKEFYWQLSPFVEGAVLKRPQYVFDRWRGKVLAEFMIKLKRKTKGISALGESKPFSLKAYIYQLWEVIQRHNKDLIENFNPVLNFLEEEFMDVYSGLPVSFCHGDCHPLNVIWSSTDIKAVIDWEFLGYKPEIFDVANLIGCVGFEDPRGLNNGLILEFMDTIKKAGLVSETSLRCLPEFIIALRFGWLSEWLRKKDIDMIEMEEAYMKLLIKNKDLLKEEWGILASIV